MKKLIVLCLVSGIVCSTIFIVNAKNNGTKKQLNLNNYVDSNNDGICDNKEINANVSTGNNYVDSNNDGVCDNIGNRNQYRHKNR